jgi:ribonuclease BN (tRNA processing enzyme)
MELRVLGCHGGETPKHRTSSFLLDSTLAIDAGAITGTLALDEQQSITAVLVSHAHMDHVRDLATLADNRCQQGGPPLEIVGTPATLLALRQHFFNGKLWPDFSQIETPRGPTVAFRPVEPEATAIVAGATVTPVLVAHTIETAGFIIEKDGRALAYSGDTGPTERFWEVLNARTDLAALLMEVSFPNGHQELAHVSGHHTPRTLAVELEKLADHAELPILLYHIKPVFQAEVEQEVAKLKGVNLTVTAIGDQYVL